MKNLKIKDVIVFDSTSIKETMRNIDLSGTRVAYIVDKNNKLIGAVSDSEIRKSIVEGKDIKTQIRDIINPNPVILFEKDLSSSYLVRKIIAKLLSRMPGSEYVLVVDKSNYPKNLVFIHELLGKKISKKGKTLEKGKRVLVVGGAGYLGSVLVRKLLSRGFKVRVLDILMFGGDSIIELKENSNFELIEGDMRNISTLARAILDVNAVVSLAAIVGDPACKNRPEAAIETNYLANKVLADACKYHQVNKYLYASTCSVYGAMEGIKELDEDSPLNPISLYARSKIQSEEGILSLEDENFSPIILRMATLYGYSPRMRFDLVVNTMTKTAIVDKKIAVHGGGLQWRPLLNVDDAAEAYVKCLESPLKKVKGEIFNVGSSKQNYQIIEIAKIVNKYIPNSKLVIEDDVSDSRNYFVSFRRLENKLGFRVFNNLEKSILRIKKAIEGKEIINVNDSKYYNVEFS